MACGVIHEQLDQYFIKLQDSHDIYPAKERI